MFNNRKLIFEYPPKSRTGFEFQIISNTAYGEIGKGWKLIRELWKDRNEKKESVLLPAFSLEGLKNEYTYGIQNKENINPDSRQLDYLRMYRPNAHNVNPDL